jgi:uncharacterized protein DUF4259
MGALMLRWEEVGDWLERLAREDDELVRTTLAVAAAAAPDEELPHLDCEQVLAAAEIVASAAGAAPDELPDAVRAYVERHGVPDEEVVADAFRAVERVGMQKDEHDEGLVDLEERLGALLSA